MTLKIGLLLVGFNRAELLIRNFEHIREFWSNEIIVVVDGPRDKNLNDIIEQKKIKEYFYGKHNVRLIINEQNRGCKEGVTWAINKGFAINEALFVIEDDCFVQKNWFDAVHDYVTEQGKNQQYLLIGSDCKFRDMNSLKLYYNDSPLIWGWFLSKDVWNVHKTNYSDSEIVKHTRISKRNFWFRYGNMYRFFASKTIDTWDYGFKLSMFENNIKMMCFNKRFSENLGHVGGTHHTKKSKGIEYHETFKITSIIQDDRLRFKFELQNIYNIKSLVQALLTFILLKIGFKYDGRKIVTVDLS